MSQREAVHWVSGMLESFNEALECEGYRLSGVICPPSIWDGIAHAAGVYAGKTVPASSHMAMMVGGHKVWLTRGIAMAFDFRAVPL